MQYRKPYWIVVATLLLLLIGGSSQVRAQSIPITNTCTTETLAAEGDEAATNEACQTDGVNYRSLGTNLEHVIDWTTEMPFLDPMKFSSGWLARKNWSTLVMHENDKIEVDANGWVRRLPHINDSSVLFRWVSLLLFTDFDGHYPAGYYTVLYEGEGELHYGKDAVKVESQSVPGREVFFVENPTNGVEIHLLSTNESNYLRDMRILMPGVTEAELETETFNPEFLETLNAYNTLRFMNWERINYVSDWTDADARAAYATAREYDMARTVDGTLLSTESWGDQIAWTARSKPYYAFWSTDYGVPIEVMIELLNEVNANGWFNIPHSADNGYVWSFAALVRDNLDANQKVYVEYSNEVWNGQFGQHHYINEKGNQLWGHQSDTTQGQRRVNYYAMRTAEVCELWKQVFGDQSDRVVCVVNMQAADTDPKWVMDWLMNCPLRPNGRACHESIDAISIAPYFGARLMQGGNVENTILTWANPDNRAFGLDKLFQQLEWGSQIAGLDGSELEFSAENMARYVEQAREWDVDLVAYEAGQHLFSSESAINDLFIAANQDPRMKSIYNLYLDDWANSGGGLALHYKNIGEYGSSGSWGSAPYLDVRDESPKYQALQAFSRNTPCWWADCSQNAEPSDIPAEIRMDPVSFEPNIELDVPIFYKSNGQPVSELQFSIKYDPDYLTFDSADSDNDGIPDGLTMHVPSSYNVQFSHADGWLGVSMVDGGTRAPLTNGPLFTIHVETTFSIGSGIRFGVDGELPTGIPATACSSANGSALPCTTAGQLYEDMPTSVSVSSGGTLGAWPMVLTLFNLIATAAPFKIFAMARKQKSA